MKEFSSAGTTPEIEFFLYQLSSDRMVMEGRVGVLRIDIDIVLKTALIIFMHK